MVYNQNIILLKMIKKELAESDLEAARIILEVTNMNTVVNYDTLSEEDIVYRIQKGDQPGRENSFFNFADLCISRQIDNAIKASNRKKIFH